MKIAEMNPGDNAGSVRPIWLEGMESCGIVHAAASWAQGEMGESTSGGVKSLRVSGIQNQSNARAIAATPPRARNDTRKL
jgi:hypothetical protein